MAFFKKLKDGLKKTRDRLFDSVNMITQTFTKVDEELFEEIEETLVLADVGTVTAKKICDELRESVKKNKISDPNDVREELKTIIFNLLNDEQKLNVNTKPSIILVVGVNGVGKTTTIGKLANCLKSQGKNVILGAADTFRAAAIDQLKIWADRAEVDIICQNEGSDPSAVVFDTISAAKSRKSDVIICDTAGRLHNKKNLMAELSKMNRIIDRELPDSDKEILLVLDASTGQNAINQAIEFQKATGVTGVILTKLDGTAKGGVILAIKNILKTPVKFIGIGEQIDDLYPFDARNFVDALFEK